MLADRTVANKKMIAEYLNNAQHYSAKAASELSKLPELIYNVSTKFIGEPGSELVKAYDNFINDSFKAFNYLKGHSPSTNHSLYEALETASSAGTTAVPLPRFNDVVYPELGEVKRANSSDDSGLTSANEVLAALNDIFLVSVNVQQAFAQCIEQFQKIWHICDGFPDFQSMANRCAEVYRDSNENLKEGIKNFKNDFEAIMKQYQSDYGQKSGLTDDVIKQFEHKLEATAIRFNKIPSINDAASSFVVETGH